MERIDISEIYRWYDLFVAWKKEPLVEIRVKGSGKVLHSGVFDNPESLAEWVEHNKTRNVYFTVNSLLPECRHLPQFDQILDYPEKTIEDNYIRCRDWVFIDIDAERKITNINATDEEKKYALSVAKKVVYFLRSEGFRPPVITDSANGAHLYYRCSMLNNDENTDLVNKFLRALGSMFDDGRIKIDTSVSNASRIAKLPGTMSAKGRSNDEERPQRMCRFLTVPDTIELNDRSLFAKIAGMVQEPPKEQPSRENNWGRDRFDLQEFIKKHGIEVRQTVRTSNGTRYILDHCVFNPEHKGKDAMIFQYDDGCLAYKCFHASCSGFTWRDVRLLFEPDAYSHKGEYEDFSYRRKVRGQDRPKPLPQKESDDKGPIWLSLDQIPTIDPDSIESIATGIREWDDKIYGGTILHNLSVMTGRPASGKSTILNTVLLNSIQQGYPTAIFSGELPNHLLKSWITLPAAGIGYVKASKKRADSYYIAKDVEDRILAWLKGRLFIHNAEYGNNWVQLKEDIGGIIAKGAKNIILDNLMTIDLDYETDNSKVKAQIGFIKDLHELVRKEAIHVWLVAHPRKQVNFLRYDDISGASEIGNLADNIFVVHRVNQDFENQAGNFFPRSVVTGILESHYTNVVEVAKNRIPGNHIGELVGVFYESETKRMFGDYDRRNGPVRYGWDVSPVQQSIPVAEDFGNENQWYNQETRDLNGNDQDNDLPF